MASTVRHLTNRDLHYQPGLCCWCGDPVTGRRKTWCSKECVDEYTLLSDPAEQRKRVYRRDHGVCSQCGLDTDFVQRVLQRIREQDHREWELLLDEVDRQAWREVFNDLPGTLLDLPVWEAHAERTRLGIRDNDMQAFRKAQYRLRQAYERGHKPVDTQAPYREVLGMTRLGRHTWEADHIVPVIEGGGVVRGQDPLPNLRTLCIGCHKAATKALAGRRAKKPKP